MYEEFSKQLLQKISDEGLKIGRWGIRQEGTGSYESLVVRDDVTTATGQDARYNFVTGVSRDL